MIERINKIMEVNDMSTTQFADTINIQRPSMSHIIAGRNNPSLDFVAKVLKAFPNINPDWLIFGDGKMYRNMDNNESQKEVSNLSTSKPSELNFENSIELDLFSTNENNNKPDLVKTEIIIEEPKLINEQTNSIENEQENTISHLETINKGQNQERLIINDSNDVIKTDKGSENTRKISKIVFFYTDKTFSEYFPENENL